MTPPLPRRCLAAADELLRGAGGLGAEAVRAGWWPRACACLIRLALEGGVDAYWRRVKPTVAACRQGRAKQLMLRGRLGPGVQVARRVAFTWAALSAAAHHHCYELAPTAAELRRLHTEVGALLAELERRTERRGEISTRDSFYRPVTATLRPSMIMGDDA